MGALLCRIEGSFVSRTWVTNRKRALSKDKYGYVRVDLQVFGYKNELFVFANKVNQLFFVPGLAKKN
jgi:hypothetical protein